MSHIDVKPLGGYAPNYPPDARTDMQPCEASPPMPDSNNGSGRGKLIFFTIVLFVLLLVSIACIIFLSRKASVLSNELTELNNEYTNLNTAHSDLNREFSNLINERDTLQNRCIRLSQDLLSDKVAASNYRKIEEFFKIKNASNESYRFRTSSDIVFVGINEPRREIQLTTNYSGGGTITHNRSSDNAYIEFADDLWYSTTTKLFVVPRSVGTCEFAFSNESNDYKFRLLVVVTK